MEITVRPIRPDERALLERRATPTRPGKGDPIFRALLTGIAIWFALLFVDALLLPRIPLVEAVYIFGTLIVTQALTFWFYLRRWRQQFQASTAGGAAQLAKYRAIEQVEEWHVRIIDAVAVMLDEDIGYAFYLELEDGRVMVLGEVWFETGDERVYAPNRELIVTRLPEPHRSAIDVQCLGEYFTPSHTRDMTAEEWTATTFPDDGDILPGPLSRYTEPAVPSEE